MDKLRVGYLLGCVFSFVIFIALIATIIFNVSPRQITRSDFVSFYTAAQIVKDGKGSEIYNLATQTFYQKKVVVPYVREGLLPFRNLPLLAVFFIPLTFFPLVLGYKLYTLFLVVVLLGGAFLSAKLFKNLPRFLLPMIFFLYFANIITLFWGQTTIIFLFIFLYLLKLLKDQNYYRLGMVAGFLSLKPQYLIFIPFLFLLVNNKKKFLQGILISLLLICFASYLITGLSFFAKYPSFLIQTEDLSFGSRPWQMITLYYLMLSSPIIAQIGKTAIIGINCLFYSVGLFNFFKKKKKIRQNIAFSASVLLMIPLSLHAQLHDTSLALISILGMFNQGLIIIPTILFILPMFLLGFFEKGMEFVALIYLIIGLYLLRLTIKDK